MTGAAFPGLWIALAAIPFLLAGMWALGQVARARGWPAEVQRKTIHIATGLLAMALPWLFASDATILALLAFTLVAMVILRAPSLKRSAMGQSLHGVRRRSWGDICLAVSVGLVLVLSERDPLLYLLPLALLTLSDAAAALAGSAYGRRFFQVADGQKSYEGSAVFFLTALVITLIALILVSEVPRGAIVPLAVIVAGFATVIEADSWNGLDNLFLPMGVFLFVQAYHGADPVTLGLVGTGLALGLIGAMAVATVQNRSRHAARIYLVAVFLVLTVSGVATMALPLAVLAAHAALAWANRTDDADDTALDIVATLGIASFFWLALGHVTGANALDFYGMSMAGMVVILGGCRLTRNTAGTARLWPIAALGAGTMVAWSLLRMTNPPSVHWAEPGAPISAALSLGLCLALTWRIGAWIAVRPARRAALLAHLVPVMAYLWLLPGQGSLP